jgi:hypothetical protein
VTLVFISAMAGGENFRRRNPVLLRATLPPPALLSHQHLTYPPSPPEIYRHERAFGLCPTAQPPAAALALQIPTHTFRFFQLLKSNTLRYERKCQNGDGGTLGDWHGATARAAYEADDGLARMGGYRTAAGNEEAAACIAAARSRAQSRRRPKRKSQSFQVPSFELWRLCALLRPLL